jgi:hypothetical protein
VEAFFAFHPHAGRLFEASSFVATLNLPPNHPDFPPPCVLHAICAVGSLYTMAVLPTPPPDKVMAADMPGGDNFSDASPINGSLPNEIFGNHYREKDHVESFAERHVKLAKQTSEEQLLSGRKLLEGVQGKRLTSFAAGGG